MTELKTLKDLTHKDQLDIDIDKLRDEAIKWIKHYRKQAKTQKCPKCSLVLNQYAIEDALYKIEWIGRFFNIS